MDESISGDVVSGDKTTGDFVGRDKAVFLGRDLPAQQAINVGNISGTGIAIGPGATVTVYSNTTIGRIGTQIDRLRGRVTRLIPAEGALLQLAKLREPKPIGLWSVEEVELSVVGITTRFGFPKKEDEDTDNASARYYLGQLGNIEAQIVPNLESEKYSQLLQNLSNIADEIGVCAVFEHFSGFEFFLLPNRIRARPSASNAIR